MHNREYDLRRRHYDERIKDSRHATSYNPSRAGGRGERSETERRKQQIRKAEEEMKKGNVSRSFKHLESGGVWEGNTDMLKRLFPEAPEDVQEATRMIDPLIQEI